MVALVNNSASVASATPSTTLETAAFAVGGANRVLYALIGSGSTAPSDPSAVKWGGSAGASMTLLGTTLTINTNEKISLFRLISPAASTSTVHATWAGTDDERWIIAIAVEVADQTTPNGTVATATGTNHSPTVDVASVTGDLVLDFVNFMDGNGSSYTLTAGAGQTEQKNLGGGVAIGPYEGAAASKETAAGTSTTMSWAISGTGTSLGWGIFAFAVNAAAAGSAQALDGAATGGASATGDLSVELILYPDAILASSGLAGAVTDIDDTHGALDGAWLTIQ